MDCPQGPRPNDSGFTVGDPKYNLYALVTQTLSAEVAVIRVSGVDSRGDAAGRVLDVDPVNPWVTPLRVGGQPTGIATTPGGTANFVGVREPGREGIFGLPTTCLFPPLEGETRRDLTTWPACSLPSRPGQIEVLVDSADPSREHCGAAPDASLPRAGDDAECQVDLADETSDKGRRKLVVSLPEEGRLVLLDAQDVLDRERGSFAPCHIEAEIPLRSTIPRNLAQPLPADMIGENTGSVARYPQIEGSYEPRPADMDQLDGYLVVADQGGPLVHIFDSRDACNLRELEPMVATSFNEPERFVTTSRVTVSPETQGGERFVYAVDEVGQERASIITFDVSPEAGSRLPLLRDGSPLISFEAPDRLEFSSAVKDVAFASLDIPYIDPVIGESVSGVQCDPNPATSPDAIGALYRPTSEDSGARPYELRGMFGYALLSDARLMVIDIEDFDHECRRPRYLNQSSEMDFRGCRNDPDWGDYLTLDGTEDGTPTVSDEASCRSVVPHRARSARTIITEEGESIQAPALRSFARLSLDGRGLSISRLTPEGKRRPILLGVDFESPDGAEPEPAHVFVGSTVYRRDDPTEPLVIDPNTAEQSAPVLPFVEPRAYPASEVVTVTYEGDLDRTRRTGQWRRPDPEGHTDLTDDTQHYCERGVQGAELTRVVGEERFSLSGGALDRFVRRYSDYVQVTNVLFDESDAYWSNRGSRCGAREESFNGEGHSLCVSVFGIGEEDDLNAARDFSVAAAFDDHLELVSRGASDPKVAADTMSLLQCCFPGPAEYRLRAGHQWITRGTATGFDHRVIASEDDDAHCVFDDSPLSQFQTGRAFEVASTKCETINDEDPTCGVGLWTASDVVCAYDATQAGGGAIEPGEAGSECIFSNLNRRFVVYRGLDPSERDMTFGFEVVGGFRGLSIPLVSSTSSTVLPVSMTLIPEFEALGVVDSQNLGLSIVDLPNSRVAARFF